MDRVTEQPPESECPNAGSAPNEDSIPSNTDPETTGDPSEVDSENTKALCLLNKAIFNHDTNKMIVNVPQGIQNMNSEGFSSNEVNVQAVISMLHRILKYFQENKHCRKTFTPGDICILTFHTAQKHLHLAAIGELHQNLPNLKANEVKISTVREFQGQESPVVILDMTVVNHIGCLKNAKTIQSALTRAKNSLYVITSFKATYQAFQHSPKKHAFQLALFQKWRASGHVHQARFISTFLGEWSEKYGKALAG